MVGVIANLGVFFAVHVLFPAPGVFDWFAAIVAAGSYVTLRRFSTPTYVLVPVGAVLGMAWAVLASW